MIGEKQKKPKSNSDVIGTTSLGKLESIVVIQYVVINLTETVTTMGTRISPIMVIHMVTTIIIKGTILDIQIFFGIHYMQDLGCIQYSFNHT